MALALFLARAAQRHPLIDDDAFLHFRGLADDDAHAVIDEHPRRDLCGRMDLDARQKLGKLRRHARKQLQADAVQEVRPPVPGERMHPRIGEQDLKLIARGGVVLLRRGDVLAKF